MSDEPEALAEPSALTLAFGFTSRTVSTVPRAVFLALRAVALAFALAVPAAS